jgi:hypothetical protein
MWTIFRKIPISNANSKKNDSNNSWENECKIKHSQPTEIKSKRFAKIIPYRNNFNNLTHDFYYLKKQCWQKLGEYTCQRLPYQCQGLKFVEIFWRTPFLH